MKQACQISLKESSSVQIRTLQVNILCFKTLGDKTSPFAGHLGCPLPILKPQEIKPADGIPALLAIIPEPKEGLPELFLLPFLLVSATLPEVAFQYSLLYVISFHPTEIIFLRPYALPHAILLQHLHHEEKPSCSPKPSQSPIKCNSCGSPRPCQYDPQPG